MGSRLSTISVGGFPGAVIPGMTMAGNPLTLLGAEFPTGLISYGDINLIGTPPPTIYINGEPFSGGAAQTPWESNINAAGFSLFGLNNLTMTGTLSAPGGAIINGTLNAITYTVNGIGLAAPSTSFPGLIDLFSSSISPVSISGFQTPWLSDIDGAGYSLNNAGDINLATSIDYVPPGASLRSIRFVNNALTLAQVTTTLIAQDTGRLDVFITPGGVPANPTFSLNQFTSSFATSLFANALIAATNYTGFGASVQSATDISSWNFTAQGSLAADYPGGLSIDYVIGLPTPPFSQTSPRLIIDALGNVGIPVNTPGFVPQFALDVSGDIHLTGTVYMELLEYGLPITLPVLFPNPGTGVELQNCVGISGALGSNATFNFAGTVNWFSVAVNLFAEIDTTGYIHTWRTAIGSGGNLSLNHNPTAEADRSTLEIYGNFAVRPFGTGADDAAPGFQNSPVNFQDLPTSPAGLLTGDVWNNGGVLNIV